MELNDFPARQLLRLRKVEDSAGAKCAVSATQSCYKVNVLQENRIMRSLMLSRTFGLVVAVVLGCVAAASSVQAACFAEDQRLPAKTISDFIANPDQLLQSADLPTTVRDLAASSPATLSAIIALLGKANPGQQIDIGNGLAQAANLCIRSDPTYAADIQTQLTASNSDAAKTKFAAITGNNTRIEATGGGAGGFSAGASGGQTNTLGGGTPGGGGFQAFGPNSVTNIGVNYFTSSVTGAGSANPGTTTSVQSVSP